MDHKSRKKCIVVFVAALLLTVTAGLIGVFAPQLPTAAQQLFGAAAAPFRSAAGMLSQQLETVGDYALGYQALQQRVAELEEQVARLNEENREAQAALEENARLRDLLKIPQKQAKFSFAPARVIARASAGWKSELTLDVGTAHGVETGMCVVTQQGYLVGVVTQTANGNAVVRTLCDPDTAIGGRINRTDDVGVLKGDLDHMTQGMCRLDYLSQDALVVAGDTVVTSGLGGNYPPGLVLGTVTEAGLLPSGVACYVQIEPAAAADEVKQVYVITAFDLTH